MVLCVYIVAGKVARRSDVLSHVAKGVMCKVFGFINSAFALYYPDLGLLESLKPTDEQKEKDWENGKLS